MAAAVPNASRLPAVGQSLPRIDGFDKVTGRALYVDDLDFPGALYGRTVRSTTPRGILRAIRLDPDFDWSEIVVATAADIPGRNVVALIEHDQPVLVPLGGEIRHAEEPVALVAASTKRLAELARAHIVLEVDPLPALLSAEEALAGSVLIHGPDNVFKRLQIVRGGDVEAALAACELVIDSIYRTGAQEQMYIEPQGMAAWWEDERTCRVIGSLQCPYYVHKALMVCLGLDEAGVKVAQAVTGGGFGGKEEYPSILAAHAAILALKARAPVKIVYERDEDVAATTKRHPSIVRHRLGLARDGTLRAADIDVVLDGGAYVTLSPVVLSRAVLHAAGPYRIPCVRVRGRAVATNTPPHGAFRGFGAPQATFAYERQMQKAARRLGIEPFELRRKNMLRTRDSTATGQVLGWSVGSEQVLDALERAARQPSPYPSEPRSSSSDRLESPTLLSSNDARRRGRGLAFYFHGAGFTGSGEERLKGRAAVRIAPDGFEVLTGSTDIGQGMLTTFAQIAADALGVGLDHVSIAEADTAKVPDSGPTVASRTCMVVGAVVERAARALRERLERWARGQGRDPADLLGAAQALLLESSPLEESCAYSSPPGIHWDDDTYSGDAYPVYGWAACLVEVAVDVDTYEVEVERCLHAVDVGKAIHPAIVKGQIEGATLQALGWALWESVQYKDGRVQNKRMTDCIIPTAMEAPEMETLLVEVPYPYGPHGAKGVGEIPMDGPAAAVAGALEDALGVPFDELPILPEAVARALAVHAERKSA